MTNNPTNNLEKITGFEDRYAIRDDGLVWSYVTNRWMKPSMGNAGYLRQNLSLLSKKKNYAVHRLVAITYIPNPHNKPCVNHKDGDKTNNSVSNLEWVTNKENQMHASENHLFHPKSGMEHPYRKKTHCVNGHPLSGENLKMWGHYRRCKQCNRDNVRKYTKRKRALALGIDLTTGEGEK